jgi:parvulin-like peptidyl-prolyl isomerase
MNPIKLNKALSLFALLFVFTSSVAQAQHAEATMNKDDPNLVLAYQGEAVLTQQEIDAAFNQIPEKHRLAFIRDGSRVTQLVRNLLEIKMLTNDAIARGFTDEPLVQTTVALAADEELAKLWTQHIPTTAPEVDFAALAKEDYLANPKSYDKDSSIDITQILLNTEDRSLEQAQKEAHDLKVRLNAEPELFQKFVALYSDDDSKVTSFGQLKNVTRGQMVPEFQNAAFALTSPGEISDPVTTKFGVHLIRLDAINNAGIPPFEDVREEAIERQKAEYQQVYMRKYLSQLFREPAVFPEGSLEIMVKRHFGENLEKAPDYSNQNED